MGSNDGIMATIACIRGTVGYVVGIIGTVAIHWKAKNNHFRFSLFSLQDFFWMNGKVEK